jgi:hypothetical protein
MGKTTLIKAAGAFAFCLFGFADVVNAAPRVQLPSSTRVGPPIKINTTSSDNECNWGPDFEPYFQTAARRRDETLRSGAKIEGDHFGSTRVNRPWGRLTVTAVASGYEGRAVYFREPLAVVLAQLTARGFGLQRSQGFGGHDVVRGMNLGEFTSSSVVTTTKSADRRFGQTAWNCGM